MAVYLLHIDPPLRHSRHYIGFAYDGNLEERLKRHKLGTGGTLPKHAIAAGSTITVAHVWPGASREFERYVKRHGGATRWCPLCKVLTRKMPQPERMPIAGEN